MNLALMQTAINWWDNIDVNHLEKVLKAKETHKPTVKIKHLSIRSNVNR